MVSGGEWTFVITAQNIQIQAGAVITQGSITGILKTTLTGAGTTTIVLHSAPGITFSTTTTDLTIGTNLPANQRTTVAHANIQSATVTAMSTHSKSVAAHWSFSCFLFFFMSIVTPLRRKEETPLVILIIGQSKCNQYHLKQFNFCLFAFLILFVLFYLFG